MRLLALSLAGCLLSLHFLGLPGLDGLEVCRQLRHEGVPVPVLMLTARSELDERLEGFDVGADDYLIKPVALAELEARLAAHVRRARGELNAARLQVGDLLLDERTHEVSRAGRILSLPRKDFDLLRILMRASPAVVTRERLEREVWGDDPPDTDALRAHVHTLRRAIDGPGLVPLLRTVHGVGYRLTDADEPSQ